MAALRDSIAAAAKICVIGIATTRARMSVPAERYDAATLLALMDRHAAETVH